MWGVCEYSCNLYSLLVGGRELDKAQERSGDKAQELSRASCRASSCIIACFADTAAIVCYNMLASLPIADVCFSAMFACRLCAPAGALLVCIDMKKS